MFTVFYKYSGQCTSTFIHQSTVMIMDNISLLVISNLNKLFVMKSDDRKYGWQVQDIHECNKFDLDTTQAYCCIIRVPILR